MALAAAVFVYSAFNFVLTALQDYMTVISEDTALLGLSFGAFTLSSLSFRFVSGALQEKYGDRLILSIGLFIIAIVTLSYTVLILPIELIMLRAINGIGWAFASLSVFTLVVKLTPAEKTGKGIGYINAINSIGLLVLPALGSAITFGESISSFSFLFLLASLLNIVGIPIIWISKSKNGFDSKPENIENLSNFPMLKVIKPTLSIFLVCLALGAVYSYSPTLAEINGVENSGYYISAFALAQIIGSIIGGNLTDRIGFKPVATIGGTLSTIGILILSFFQGVVPYFLSAIFFGFGLVSVSISLTARSTAIVQESQKSKAMAVFFAGYDGGVMAGSFIIAAMIQLELGFLVALLLLAAGAFMSILNSYELSND